MDALRGECRRLRETGALLQEWKVTPTISFLRRASGVDASVTGPADAVAT
jgi:hypothetical protein